MKTLRVFFWVGLVVLGVVFVGNAADTDQSAYPVQVAKQESRWDSADLGGPSAAGAKSRWDTADLGGPSASRAQSRWDTADLGGPSASRAQSRWDTADLGGPSASRAQSRWDTADLGGPSAAPAQTQGQIGAVVISLYDTNGNLLARWNAADLGGPSAAGAQSRWDTANLGGPSASRAQSRWDTADLGGPSAAGAKSRWDSADLGGPSAAGAQSRWDTADLGGPSAAGAQSRWDTADLGGPSASRAQSRWDTADLGGPSAAGGQSRWDSADLGGPSAAGGQSRWDTANLGGPSTVGAQDQLPEGSWDKDYRVWKRVPRVQIVDRMFDRDQVGNGLVDIIGKEDLKIYFQDFNYIPVRFEWLQQYVRWWEGAKATFGINYADDQFDCENFARLFKALADSTILGLQRKESSSLAFATLLVYPKKAFGGVGPESGTHVLNLVGTDRGWIVIEPQTGAMVELSKYPNVKTIIGLAFG